MFEKIGRREISLAGGDGAAKKIVLSHEELALLLGGIDLTSDAAPKVVSQASGGSINRVTENRINTGIFRSYSKSKYCYSKRHREHAL